MTKTTNYQLNQWAKSDRVMMDDFNADNAKIDAALKANADAIAAVGYVTGTYTGTGSYPRTIDLGFQPKAVVVTTYTGYTNNSGTPFGGVFGVGMPLSGYAEVTANGFTLKEESVNKKTPFTTTSHSSDRMRTQKGEGFERSLPLLSCGDHFDLHSLHCSLPVGTPLVFTQFGSLAL